MTRKTKHDGMEYDHKQYRWHGCPHCAGTVLPFADGTNRGHCAKHGTVVYVTMMEVDYPAFRETVKNQAPTNSVTGMEYVR